MADKTKIDWADASANPWWGCSKGCPYCYARGIARRFGRSGRQKAFIPTWRLNWIDVLNEARDRARRKNTSQVVFLESMGDFFDPKVPDAWRDKALEALSTGQLGEGYWDLDFVILTKRPRLIRRDLPTNVWVGISIDGYTDATADRVVDFLKTVRGTLPISRRVLCIEPYLERIPRDFLSLWIPHFCWIIVGGRSGAKEGIPAEWLADIDEVTTGKGMNVTHVGPEDWGVPLFVKKNAGVGRQEFPPNTKRTIYHNREVK